MFHATYSNIYIYIIFINLYIYIYNLILQLHQEMPLLVSLYDWAVKRLLKLVKLHTQHSKGPKVNSAILYTTFSHNSHRMSFSGHDETSVHMVAQLIMRGVHIPLYPML